jgi:hypothetical protein
VFTVRFALSPYTKQIRFVFKGLMGVGPTHTVHKVVPIRIRLPECFALDSTEKISTKTGTQILYFKFMIQITTIRKIWRILQPISSVFR